jgi:hypothetical protein
VDQILLPVNDSIDSLPVEISYSNIPFEKYEWLRQLEATFQHHKETFGSTEKELEDIKVSQHETNLSNQHKKTFLETDRTLLYVTATVAFFHLLFDFLAFKNGTCFFLQFTLVCQSIKHIVTLLHCF